MAIPVGEVLSLTRTSGDAPSPRLPFSSSKDQVRPNPSCLCLLESLLYSPARVQSRRQGCPGQEVPRVRLAGTAVSHGLCCPLLPSGPWCGGIQGTPVCCPLSRPSHQPSWQTSPFTHPYLGPGPARTDGRGADGLFESFPFVLPQDTLRGKPWKSLFYFGPMRASSSSCQEGLCWRKQLQGKGPTRGAQGEHPGIQNLDNHIVPTFLEHLPRADKRL